MVPDSARGMGLFASEKKDMCASPADCIACVSRSFRLGHNALQSQQSGPATKCKFFCDLIDAKCTCMLFMP
jgi:hypothetical protein